MLIHNDLTLVYKRSEIYNVSDPYQRNRAQSKYALGSLLFIWLRSRRSRVRVLKFTRKALNMTHSNYSLETLDIRIHSYLN